MTDTTVHRGTTNRDVRGSSYARRKRREWLVETYRADVDVLQVTYLDGTVRLFEWPPVNTQPFEIAGAQVEVVHACRCYRCAELLTVDTVTVDRIKPGCQGGKYGTPAQDAKDGRTNIRPACGRCNSSTGGRTRA